MDEVSVEAPPVPSGWERDGVEITSETEPEAEVEFAPTEEMLLGHQRRPALEPLLQVWEKRVLIGLFLLALLMVLAGGGVLFGLSAGAGGVQLWRYLG